MKVQQSLGVVHKGPAVVEGRREVEGHRVYTWVELEVFVPWCRIYWDIEV